jgi:hypothetical protein
MPEDQNNKWKAAWHDDHLKVLCGFANAKGGHLLLGYDDFGRALGVSDSKPLVEELAGRIRFTMDLPEILPLERLLNYLAEKPHSKSEIAFHLGQKGVTGALNRTVKQLFEESLIEYTAPEKTNTRLQIEKVRSMKAEV